MGAAAILIHMCDGVWHVSFQVIKRRSQQFALMDAGGLQRQFISESALSGAASVRRSKTRIGQGRASIG